MALIHTLEKEWKKKLDRNWNQIYIAVDLHDTVIESDYTKLATNVYDDAVRCLSYLSQRHDIILIMWTGSTAEDIKKYAEMLEMRGIKFDFYNENPMEVSGKNQDFNTKFYFNILLDDKAGFYPKEDWSVVYDFFLNHP